MTAREDGLLERMQELSSNLDALLRENATLTMIIAHKGDPLVKAASEIKALNQQVEAMHERIDGLMREKNDAIRAAKASATALRKALAKSGGAEK